MDKATEFLDLRSREAFREDGLSENQIDAILEDNPALIHDEEEAHYRTCNLTVSDCKRCWEFAYHRDLMV